MREACTLVIPLRETGRVRRTDFDAVHEAVSGAFQDREVVVVCRAAMRGVPMWRGTGRTHLRMKFWIADIVADYCAR